jgi:hypothetical protein
MKSKTIANKEIVVLGVIVREEMRCGMSERK